MHKFFKKRVVAVGLACAVNLMLASCGKESLSESSEPEKKGEEATEQLSSETSEQVKEQVASPGTVDAASTQNSGDQSSVNEENRQEQIERAIVQVPTASQGVIAESSTPVEGMPTEFTLEASATPVCSAVGSRSEGWYVNEQLIQFASCAGQVATCQQGGSRTYLVEGYYAQADGRPVLVLEKSCVSLIK